MNADQMLDYTLGQLDLDARARADRELDAAPELADRIARLDRSLRLLLDDGPGPEPPAGLARRTINRVERSRRWRAVMDPVPARSPFRFSDFAVAAGIFCVGVLTLLPSIRQSQWSARTAQCAANLQTIGVGLLRYASTHDSFPYPDGDGDPVPYAGSFGPRLVQENLVDNDHVFDCPSNGPRPPGATVPALAQLVSFGAERARSAPCIRDSDYAYNIGYRDRGKPCKLRIGLSGEIPLVADGPRHDHRGHALPGNSPNHGGTGQNVLHCGGHVRYMRNVSCGRDSDIFRNRHNRTAPGINGDDYVLAPGPARFDGN